MFVPIKYGTKRVMLGIHDPFPFQCPNCKQINTVDYAIYGEYYHFWYIPVFPFEKDGYAKCSRCDFRINSLKYNKLTQEDFRQVKKKFKYPFYTYTGAAIFIFPILVAIVLSIIS
jgi:phage FluMu protein Com